MGMKDNILLVARQEIGYQEGDNNYTKYGEWYENNIAKVAGFKNAPWCNMFITWLFDQIGCCNGIVYPNTSPEGSLVSANLEWFEKHNCRYSADEMPEPGDLVYYSWTGEYLDHIGICEKVEGTKPDNAILTVIEGNMSDGSVGRRRISYRNTQVYATVRPMYPQYIYSDDAMDFTDITIDANDSGDAVKLVQVLLNALEFDIAIDGIYGEETIDSIKQVQKIGGITVDGICGKDTLEEIFWLLGDSYG